MTIGHADIYARIKEFNKTFGLPAPSVPTLGSRLELLSRLEKFKEIILKEVDEVDDIIDAVKDGKDPLEVAVMLSDWTMDIVVYAISEATRHGLPSEAILHIIMNSQVSKLGPGGQPIIADGKVQKGPNYVAPEPMIKNYLEALMHAATWEARS